MLIRAHLNYFIRGDEHGIQKDHPQSGFRRPRHGHLPGTKPQHQAKIASVASFSNLSSHYQECREKSDLDSDQRLCAGGYREEDVETGPKPLHNFTDFECHSF
jgi:hypothetical protein